MRSNRFVDFGFSCTVNRIETYSQSIQVGFHLLIKDEFLAPKINC